MLTQTGRRVLNRALQSLLVHNDTTVDVLERLVEDLHEHPLLVPYQLMNHDRFEDLVWGIIKIMDTKGIHSPTVSGNAAYVLGAILDTEVGKDKIFRFFSDPMKLDQHRYILPNLTTIMESGNEKAAVNSSGTLAVLVETENGRIWALKQPSFDWVLHILAKSLTSKQHLLASNCSLALARICQSEEGCSRILNFRNSKFILTQLIKALGIDKEGTGMNCAFALAYLCDKGPGLKRTLSLVESTEMVASLVVMLCSADEGCSKNACFALRNIANKKIGQDRLIRDPNIDRLLRTLSSLLMSKDEETAKFAATGLRYLAAEREGYLRQKDHPMVKPTLRRVLSNPQISQSYRKEAHKTLETLLLKTPLKPTLQVLDAHSIKVSWQEVWSRSGLAVIYGLFMGDEVIYEGQETSFIMQGLEEMTSYSFRLRAWTGEDEESGMSETASATTYRAVSTAPKGLRAISVTASQIKIAWDLPERLYGILNGFIVRERGRDIKYEPVDTYHIAGNLKPNTEYTFEVSAMTKRGEGEKTRLTVQTLRQDTYAPTKPNLIAIGPHEILATWKAPSAPIGRINGYEVLVNGKRAYYGLDKRCLVKLLQPDTQYEFTVVAWTNEGRCESEPAEKKTPVNNRRIKRKPWKTKEELLDWLESQDNSLSTDRSTKSSASHQSSRSFASISTVKSQGNKSQGDQSRTDRNNETNTSSVAVLKREFTNQGNQPNRSWSRNNKTNLFAIKEKPSMERSKTGRI